MLIDGRTLPSAPLLQAKFCIVGTGMGALSVARVLVEAGIDVLMVEAGPIAAARQEAPVLETDNIGRSFRLQTSRGLEVGGGTAYWHGICAQLDEIDFQRRAWVPHSGWAIGSEQLAPHYRKAWDFLCGGDHSGAPAVQAGLAQQPHAADKLRSKVYQFASPPFRGKEMLLGWCRTGKARCLTHSVALKFIMSDNGTARRLVVGCGDRTFEVQAERFIVAAGALETPRLLLNSGTGIEPGLGKDLWWLGRNLMDHPAAYVCQVRFRERVKGHLFSGFPIGAGVSALPGFVIQDDAQRQQRLPNHTVFIRPGLNARKVPNVTLMSFLGVRGAADLRARHVKAIMTDRYIRWRVIHQRLPLPCQTRFGDLFFMTEQLPNPDSRVDLSERKRDRYGYPVARIDWQLSREDAESFGRTLDLVMSSLARHPLVDSTRKDDLSDWLDAVSSAAHHLGTARLANSAAEGVVDTDLKVFGTNNVWVCDGSVFPTAGSVNPSLTICALGHRLASHLLAHEARRSSVQAAAANGASTAGEHLALP